MTTYIIKNSKGEFYNGLGNSNIFSSVKSPKEFNNLCNTINAISTIKCVLRFTNQTDRLFVVSIKLLPNGKKKETIVKEYPIEY